MGSDTTHIAQTAVADSGCTSHFLTIKSPCTHKTPTHNGLKVQLPNREIIQASYTTLLNLLSLPITACPAHLFQKLKHNALISTSQLCDNGFQALFTATHIKILHNSTTILCSTRNKIKGLWQLQLTAKPPASPTDNTNQSSTNSYNPSSDTNSLYKMSTKTDLVQDLHKCCFSPTTSAWLKAVKAGFFTTWPGLDKNIVTNH